MLQHGGDIYRNKVNMDFSVNVSPFGVPSTVRAAISKAVLNVNTYPDPLYEKLRTAIGQADNFLPESIVCGNGASELIYAVVRVIANITDNRLEAGLLAPCFLEYKKALEVAGFENINSVMLSEDNGFLPTEVDIDKLVTGASVIILGNPNNPTGRLLDKVWLKKLLSKAEDENVYVILDECFLPLTAKSKDYRDLSSRNLIRIRAYTKSMAIPGVRLGYLYSENIELVEEVRAVLPDWNVSVIAQEAGIACAEATNWLENKVLDEHQGLAVLRDNLSDILTMHDIKVFSSDTNYLLVKSDLDLYGIFLEKGILIRDCSNYEGLSKGYFRFAVKSLGENTALFENDVRDDALLCVTPKEIEQTSFEILTGELEAKGIYLEGDTAPIIKRCIHTTADFDYASTLTFSDNAVDKIKDLIREGACIVTDTNMALAGINKTELKKYGGECYCFMADPEIAKMANERGCTRATVSMEHAATLGKKLIFVVGNAPTALVTLCDMVDNKGFSPDFVIGVPVGFVNVERSKEMIIERDLDYIVNRGRKGGSNVAAAIVNAVLYSMRDE